MKNSIRRNKKKVYWVLFYPEHKKFKYKKDLMKYLRSLPVEEAVNTEVVRDVNSWSHSGAERRYQVWYNEYVYRNNLTAPFRLELRQVDFRGKKFIIKLKSHSTRFFAYSDKVINLMCLIGNDGITDSRLVRLIDLFRKRFGGKLPYVDDTYDYEVYPDIQTLDQVEWWYWSDRCNWDRTVTVLRCIKNEKPYLLEEYEWKI